MNKPAYLFFSLIAVLMLTFLNAGYGQSFAQRYLKEHTYFFDDTRKIYWHQLFTLYKQEFDLGPDDFMQPSELVVSDSGTFHIRFDMYHKGVPVEPCLMNAGGSKNIVLYATGSIVKGLNEDTAHIISPKAAIAAALQFVNASEYAWEDSSDDRSLRAVGNDTPRSGYPKPRLVITQKRGDSVAVVKENFQLCYLVSIRSVVPARSLDVYVNANDGTIFTYSENLKFDYSTDGSVKTWYNGYRQNDMTTRTCSSCLYYWLHDKERGIYTTTKGTSWYKTGSYNKDRDDVWDDNSNRTAASAHWGVQKAWDYYFYKRGRWGSDNHGKRVHIKTDETEYGLGLRANAAYSFTDDEDLVLITPDGRDKSDPNEPGYSYAALDVMGHELTHGMIHGSSRFGDFGGDGIFLAEGYCDIFGVVIDHYVNGILNWRYNSSTDLEVRPLDEPHTGHPFIAPETFQEFLDARFHPGSRYYTEKHNLGGPLRKWFYLTAAGGLFHNNDQNTTNYIGGLGLDKTAELTYIAMTWWMYPNLFYADMARQTVNATAATYGSCSYEHKQVALSFYALGFPVDLPHCRPVKIRGTQVIDRLATTNLAGTAAAAVNWTAEFTGPLEAQSGGAFEWLIPSGWSAIPSGNQLTLLSVADTSSKLITVRYTSPAGQVSTDTMAVHVNSLPWIATPGLQRTARTGATNTVKEAESKTPEPVLYPNPASGNLYIRYDQPVAGASFYLIDLWGNVVVKTTINSFDRPIDVLAVPKGLYIAKILLENKVVVSKIEIR